MINSARQSIVWELFAHDREDLAWRAAKSARATILAIQDRDFAATRAGSPARGRLARAALEELDDNRDADLSPRSRSPILEMPADLATLAIRNGACDALLGYFPGLRRTRTGWGRLRLSVEGTPYDARLVLASSAEGIDGTLDASQAAEGQLAKLGWRRDAGGTWAIAIGLIGATQAEAIAARIVDSLIVASQSTDPKYTIYHAFEEAPADRLDVDMVPGVRLLARDATDAEVVAYGRDWLEVLAKDQFQEALDWLSHWPDEEERSFTPASLREYLGNYASWEPWADGTVWRVTSPGEAGEGEEPPSADSVVRDEADSRLGFLEIGIPLNGMWSDVTARFDLGPSGDEIGVALVDVLVD